MTLNINNLSIQTNLGIFNDDTYVVFEEASLKFHSDTLFWHQSYDGDINIDQIHDIDNNDLAYEYEVEETLYTQSLTVYIGDPFYYYYIDEPDLNQHIFIDNDEISYSFNIPSASLGSVSTLNPEINEFRYYLDESTIEQDVKITIDELEYSFTIDEATIESTAALILDSITYEFQKQELELQGVALFDIEAIDYNIIIDETTPGYTIFFTPELESYSFTSDEPHILVFANLTADELEYRYKIIELHDSSADGFEIETRLSTPIMYLIKIRESAVDSVIRVLSQIQRNQGGSEELTFRHKLHFKDPDATNSFSIDWQDYLDSKPYPVTEPVFEWIVPNGLWIAEEGFTYTKNNRLIAYAWIGGGKVKETYTVTCRIKDNKSPLVDDKSIQIYIQQK